MLRNRTCLFSTDIYSSFLIRLLVVTSPSIWLNGFELGQYILFVYSMAVILDAFWFCMETVFYCSNFGLRLNDFHFYVMGKKYMLSLLSAILVLWNRVKSSKITSYFVVSSCSEQNICILVDEFFNIFQYFWQDWLTDYSHIYWISTLQKHVQKELSLQMMKNSEYSNSTYLIKNYENRKYFIFDDSCVKVPHTSA